MNRPFKSLARGMYAMGQAVYCDESCWHIHDGHGCEHEGHACGCPHSASYEFEWDQPEQWSDAATVSLLHFLSALRGDLAADEIE